jgi:glycine/D-amino acid oxidase-like deaminating enzyme
MSSNRIVVVGLGYVGLPLAVALARTKSSASTVTANASPSCARAGTERGKSAKKSFGLHPCG